MKNLKATVCDLFLHTTKSMPEQNAIGSIEKSGLSFISFKSYQEIVESYSLALSQIGVKPQNKVCILSNTRKEWNYLDLAIMGTGAVTVPIYPSYTPNEVLYIIKHCEAEFIIVENQEQFLKLTEIQNELTQVKKIISIEQIKIDDQNKLKDISYMSLDELYKLGNIEMQREPDQFEINIKNISPESLATIVYTSGTTGEPKGAMIKHEALFQVLMNAKKYTHNSIYHRDRFLTYLPLSHVLGRLESFFPILFSCETVYARDMKTLVNDISIVKPTFLVAVPRVLEKIYEKAMAKITQSEIKKLVFELATKSANHYFNTLNKDKTPDTKTILEYQLAKKVIFSKIYKMFGGRIRFFISGGAPLSPKINEFLRNANLTVLEGYGLTESVAPCFINPMNKQELGTVGKPMGDVEVKFASDNEILIRSKALFCGYYKNEAETNKVLSEDGWFKTGDIGEFTPNGFLKITDRKKDIIITSGGKNVAPQKLENMLKLSPNISQALIVGNQRKYLTALIGVEIESLTPKLNELGISTSTPLKDLCNRPEINDLIEADITEINKELASFESIKKFVVLPVELTTDNYLTPSLKIKKKLIHRDFKNLIEGMYKES